MEADHRSDLDEQREAREAAELLFHDRVVDERAAGARRLCERQVETALQRQEVIHESTREDHVIVHEQDVFVAREILGREQIVDELKLIPSSHGRPSRLQLMVTAGRRQARSSVAHSPVLRFGHLATLSRLCLLIGEIDADHEHALGLFRLLPERLEAG